MPFEAGREAFVEPALADDGAKIDVAGQEERFARRRSARRRLQQFRQQLRHRNDRDGNLVDEIATGLPTGQSGKGNASERTVGGDQDRLGAIE